MNNLDKGLKRFIISDIILEYDYEIDGNINNIF